VLEGTVAFVPDAPGADLLVAIGETADGTPVAAAIDADAEGVSVEALTRYDATRSLAHVSFSQARGRLLSAGPDLVATYTDFEVIDAAESPAKTLAELIDTSVWQIRLPQVAVAQARAATEALLALDTAPVERATKDGTRTVDVRASVRNVTVSAQPLEAGGSNGECATLEVVGQHSTPAVRPDDILTALRTIGALSTPVTPVVTRLAQGLIDDTSPEDAKRLIDPLA